MRPRPRILVVGERFPWPPNHGAGIRLANVVAALARAGEVDFFAMVHTGEAGRCRMPDDVGVSRTEVVERPAANLSPARRLRWLARGDLPLELYDRDYRAAVRTLRRWGRAPYDVAWFGDAEAFVALRSEVDAPAIVDLDDLDDHTAWVQGTGPRAGALALARAGPAGWERRLRGAKNTRMWRRLQARMVAQAAAVAVCSEADRRRLGATNAAVVPNGYTAPARPLGRAAVGTPPTVLFVGYLRYGPNVDAAVRLVKDVGPRVWASRPEVQIRLVGHPNSTVAALHGPPHVIVTGAVDDLGPELARADVSVIPLLAGAGTRVKILEAFAHRIPVVATAVAAAGLDVQDGAHLLLAEDADALAAACLRVLEDEGLRAHLADGAQRLFEDRYRWDLIHSRIAALAIEAAGAGEGSIVPA